MPWVFVLAALGGCVSPRPMHTESLASRTEAGWRNEIPHDESSAAKDVAEWWRTFDPTLEALATRALAANLDLAVARERVVEAQARRGIVSADRRIQIDAEGSYLHAATGDQALAFAAPPPGAEKNLYAAGVVAGWELDLWGRVGRLVDAARADSAAAIERYHDVAVSLVSELALAYIDVRALDRRLSLVKENVELQQRTLDLAEARLAAGNGPELDVMQARRLLRRTSARVPELQRAKAVAENRIAVLLGTRPADGLVPDGDLPSDVCPVEMGLPAELIARRPDIRQAMYAYKSALLRTEAADLERLPQVRLNGTFKLSADNLGDFKDNATIYSIGPQISFPLLDGARINATVSVRQSQAEQARLVLEQALLRAIEEVENAAVGYMRRRAQVGELEKAVEAARRSEEMADQLYRAGLRSLDQSVDAQRQLVEAEDDLVVARQQMLGETVRLYRALGGGWEQLALEGDKTVGSNIADAPAPPEKSSREREDEGA